MSRKRAKLEEAFAWIAANDNPGDAATVDEIAGWVTVKLVADLWGLPDDLVARAVDNWRKKLNSGTMFDTAYRTSLERGSGEL